MTGRDNGQELGVRFRALDPIVLRPREAALFICLIDEDQDEAAARRCLNRLVDTGALRPVLLGGKRVYSVDELRRLVAERTARYGEPP